ncbi:hypothetical protein [Cupriavidus lacunae]|uniref:hypothetical protein n=1 Tax=Cupriavidus lacunae TaxID=2666307 RepID=UPI0013752AE8|nr:hypothetical protein [Cupriavidus lacunae]
MEVQTAFAGQFLSSPQPADQRACADSISVRLAESMRFYTSLTFQSDQSAQEKRLLSTS